MKKFARTISGVTPVAVMSQPMECPGQCVYCPTYPATPRSYTPESPAVLRARQCDYDAGKQVRLRLKILAAMGHPTDKVELIVMGGTFLAYPVDYQEQFIKGCFDALNGEESATLEEAKRRNETARHRCTGLCLETRPDWCGEEQIARMLEFGATRVELGVQTLDDEIYRLVRRGHTVADVVQATKLLREHGFKVHYHWMPGLPGATPAADLEQAQQLFSDARFRPDGLKLYPTMVVAGTELAQWYQEGRYQPYDKETMINLLADIKAIVPKYVRISRVLRDIPAQFIIGGLRDSLRDVLKERLSQRGTECRCIRCREYGHRAQANRVMGEPSTASAREFSPRARVGGEPRLVRMDYPAAAGQEIFLSFEDERETLFGLLRLRLQTTCGEGRWRAKPIARLAAEVAPTKLADRTGRESSMNIALIRELHVYGAEVPLKQHLSAEGPAAVQHKGLGKALLAEAERIAREEFQARLMVVLSGVGAREYYRTEFGYRSQADYMVKDL